MRILFLALLCAAQLAHAQSDWPKREVRILIGFSAGGTTDIVTRLISNDLAKALGQPIVIENKPAYRRRAGGHQARRAHAAHGSVGPWRSTPACTRTSRSIT
jgi:tripartite-type tricarboxylate transporter receptor subunit TctC